MGRLDKRLEKLETRHPTGADYAVQFLPDGMCKVFYCGYDHRQPEIMTLDEYHAFSRQPENRILMSTRQDLDEI